MSPTDKPTDADPARLSPDRDLYVLTPVSLGITGTSALRATYTLLSRYRWLFAGAVVLTLLAGGAFAALSTPMYRVEVVLAPAGAQGEGGGLGAVAGQFGTLAALAGFSGLGASSAQEAVAVLQSRMFAAEFIRERNLLPILFSEQWDESAGKWIPEAGDAPTVADGVRLFEESLRRVSTDIDTGLVTLSLEWSDPVIVAEWANDMVARLNAVMRERDIADASRSLSYLGEQIARAEILEVRNALFALVEEQEKRRMLASVNEQYAFRVLDPAVPPEADEPVRPRPLVIMLMAMVIGLMLGMVAVLVADLVRSMPNRPHRTP